MYSKDENKILDKLYDLLRQYEDGTILASGYCNGMLSPEASTIYQQIKEALTIA